MSRADDTRVVRDYHERTKHHLHQYAASLGYLDWATQPNPFRSFVGAEEVLLEHPALRETPTYDSLFTAGDGPSGTVPEAVDAGFIARLFYHSLALSAWKKGPRGSAWSLRINPSSGALHPTEGYLITGPVDELTDSGGVFHYAPYRHRLERRARWTADQWAAFRDGFPEGCVFVALTSIYWRESWKYGERAFRYCHHDAGHAIGAVALAARTLGWESRTVDSIPDAALDRLTGAAAQEGIEAEHGDCLLALYPAGAGEMPEIAPEDWAERIPRATLAGEPNRLSRDHQDWPVIEEVGRVTRSPGFESREPEPAPPRTPERPDRGLSAERIIRQRRSAVAMNGHTSIARDAFYRMLERTLPGRFPLDALGGPARVSLGIFVHRVEGLDPGLYVLARRPEHEESLRARLRPDFVWEAPEGAPPGLGLYRLLAGDARDAARTISCQQAIAADGAFSLGMLADFDAALAADGPAAYPRLYWETGLIGQVLYLEAEAAGVRSTGIGCFFDDAMHRLLGVEDGSWQSLYHFTVGGAVDDERLQTLAPYYHLEPWPEAR